MSGALARTRAFELFVAGRAVDRVEPIPGGVSHLTPSLPSVWDLNFVWVEDPAHSAEALAADADRRQGGAGLAHRRVVVADDRKGARLAPGFRELGWKAERYLTMVAGETPPGHPGPAPVAELPFEGLRALRAELARETPGGRSPDVVEQLLESATRHARAGSARHFAVLAGGEPVAAADLYSDGRTAQIEDVATLEAHRNRGYGTAVVLGALLAARATGHDLVFLRADADDWPHELYRRLGFAPVGAAHAFTRPK